MCKSILIKVNSSLLLFTIVSLFAVSFPVNEKPVFADDSNLLRWARIDTPGSVTGKNDVLSPSEVNRIIIGPDGKTFYSIDIPDANNSNGGKALFKSTDSGRSWNDDAGKNIFREMSPAERAIFHVWNIAIAHDNPDFLAAVTNSATANLPHNVWVSTNGGSDWHRHNINLTGTSKISSIDIAKSNDHYAVAIGTRNGAGGDTVYISKYPGFNNWENQVFSGDVLALKFSPNYALDATIIIVYSNAKGTYLNAGIHDISKNVTNWTAIYGSPPEITTSGTGTSPNKDQIVSADLQLPTDFSGQAPSFRRYFVSIDATVNTAGIYRIDDTINYWLMPAINSKRIASIAYFGNYKSGKLLAGEVLGSPCSATAMTWFTDAPATCPNTCWYPSVKPPTGASGIDNCSGSGYGNTQVAWSPDGLIAYAGTASTAALIPVNWPTPYLTGRNLDESAFSVTRNNGQTWNQLSLIDTRINSFSDIAPSADCSNVYLASTNNGTNCSGFDSVWRSRSTPIGFSWERVLCKPTTHELCASGQTNTSILRLAGDKANGQYIFWAAIGTRALWWSADSGDWWGSLNPRFAIQDMAIEDANTVFILNTGGQVQKFTYNSSGWSSLKTISTGLDSGYSITTAYNGTTPDNDKGNIIVGGSGTGNFDVAYSTDGGATFTVIPKLLPTRDNTMVVASSGYRSDGYILAINSGGMYAWGIYTGVTADWETWWGGASYPSSVTGLSISRKYGFYFPTPASPWSPATPYIRWSSALANLDPAISLGTQPTTRFRICGGLESGDLINVYAIDQRTYSPPMGGVWCYVDCLSWNGPLPTEPVSLNPVGFDPVSGRNGQINIKWKPQCLAKGYQFQLSNDIDFTALIADIGKVWGGPFYIPPDLDFPTLIIPPGGGRIVDSAGTAWRIPALQPNHTYYWRIKVKNVVTGDNIESPWSWRESFRVTQGLPVTTPYYGLQLLAPDNGCGCTRNTPTCFSWTPLKETAAYRFELSDKADMSEPLIAATASTTAYQLREPLRSGTNYFWRVRAENPHPSEWSAVFSFRILPETSSPEAERGVTTPLWATIVMAVGFFLAIIILVFIYKTTRSVEFFDD